MNIDNNILTNDKFSVKIFLGRFMKQGSTLFLKIVIFLIATGALVILLWFPHIEGRNRNADFFTIYFKDAFLAYIYLTFIPFFGALFQAFKLLGHIERGNVFSEVAVRCLRNIKYFSMAMSLLISGTMPWIISFADQDDAPGVVPIVAVIIFACFVVATAAGLFQTLLQKAVDIKSENDLTV